ncbi:MAG: hypothetical protein ABEJ36_06595, partial [Candidatus Nanosalina sp.]
FTYVAVNPEEAGDYLRDETETGPGVPLSAVDIDEETVYLNGDEEWSLVADSLEMLEESSRNHYGLEWMQKAEEARSEEYETAEQYAEFLEEGGFDAEVLDSDGMIQEAYDHTYDEEVGSGSFTTANDVAGIPTDADYDDL